jgi:cytosine/adenosine deaminase-related metal-dependent hydrolase
MRTRAALLMSLMSAIVLAILCRVAPLDAQSAPQVFGPKRPPVQTQRFEGLAEGPFNRLVIRNVMIIPGHGGPPTGPHDILIEGNVITDIRSFDPVAAERARAAGRPIERWDGDRVIEGNGMYVMPGMFDLHHHVRGEELPLEYTYYLKLAHGVTTTVPASDGRAAQIQKDQAAAERYQKLAPRMFPIWGWGQGTKATREQLESAAEAPRIAREMVQQGARVVSVGGLGWNRELFGAVCKAVWDAGGTTTVHLPPSTNAVVNAVEAARLGVTFIEHHYGYAESALPRSTQFFPRNYDFDNENHRFREAGRVWEEAGWNPESRARLLNDVAQALVESGVTMLPTRVVYEANRDILRAQSLPWHEKYTHQALMRWNVPTEGYHGAFHWDWTHDDEETWRYAFDLWAQLIYQFNKRGGRVAMGTDDNYIWATAGFSNVRELQLVRESGMHSLEVLKAATHNSAQTLREPHLGLVRPGYLADLIIVDGNPAENFRHMYAFGAIRMNERGQVYRTRGIVHTIKDGVVIENPRLMEVVARMVAESKQGAKPLITDVPFSLLPAVKTNGR